MEKEKLFGIYVKHMAEIVEGAGRQYAGWLAPLLKDPEVTRDMEWLLSEGREILYGETYNLLRSVHEQGHLQ